VPKQHIYPACAYDLNGGCIYLSFGTSLFIDLPISFVTDIRALTRSLPLARPKLQIDRRK